MHYFLNVHHFTMQSINLHSTTVSCWCQCSSLLDNFQGENTARSLLHWRWNLHWCSWIYLGLILATSKITGMSKGEQGVKFNLKVWICSLVPNLWNSCDSIAVCFLDTVLARGKKTAQCNTVPFSAKLKYSTVSLQHSSVHTDGSSCIAQAPTL